jgi:hypothetical protein
MKSTRLWKSLIREVTESPSPLWVMSKMTQRGQADSWEGKQGLGVFVDRENTGALPPAQWVHGFVTSYAWSGAAGARNLLNQGSDITWKGRKSLEFIVKFNNRHLHCAVWQIVTLLYNRYHGKGREEKKRKEGREEGRRRRREMGGRDGGDE